MEIILPYNWTPRNYQMPAWQHFQPNQDGQRGVCLWHRRAGKDLFAINLISCKAAQRVGTYWHVFPTYRQGRKIAWNGFTRDGRRFLDHFHPNFVKDRNKTEMRVEFQNGALYEVVGTDNIDSLVGTNPVGCVFSEYSLQDPRAWDYIRPILAENGGWALFIYTARGKNHGYTLFNMAQGNPKWFSEKLVAGDQGTLRPDGTPVISNEIIQEERDAGMAEELILSEFFNSFDAPVIGAYYGQQMLKAQENGRITKVPHDPKLRVHTAWDLGIDDSTSIWFFQEYGDEIRVIDYFEDSGEGLPYYFRVLEGRHDGGRHRSDYVYGEHYAPHDISVRELSSGKSRIELARSLGVRFRPVQKMEVADGIEAVRSLLPMMWFDAEKCERGIESLRNYHKEFDEDKRTYKNKPEHDWSSHGADAMRTYAIGKRVKPKRRNRQRQLGEFDYFNPERSMEQMNETLYSSEQRWRNRQLV